MGTNDSRGWSTPSSVWALGMVLLSLALGCARSRTLDDGRDGAVVGADASTTEPSTDGGRDAPDGMVGPTDPTRDGGRGGDAGRAPSPEAVALARAECAWMARCLAWEVDAIFFTGEAGCVEALARAYDRIIARGHAAPPSDWCSTSYPLDADCDDLRDDDGSSIHVCVEPAGRLRSGEACLHDVECGRSAAGGEMRCFDCQCRPLLREGDEGCSDVRPCETGAFCAFREGRRVCARYRALPDGAACTTDSDPFEGCAHGSRCFEGRCAREPRRGEACDPRGVPCFETFDRVECVADDRGAYRCEETAVRPPAVRAGERCDRGDMCVGGERCPSSGVCPSDCRGNAAAVCFTGACDEATGECAIRQECVRG